MCLSRDHRTIHTPGNRREYFGIARSTLYRWLHKIDDASPTPLSSHNRTPADVAALVWDIAKTNAHWGRVRIAGQLALLGVFLAASTVRNILSRPEPPKAKGEPLPTPEPARTETRGIMASYPNHVWSIDTSTVLRWGLWPPDNYKVEDKNGNDLHAR